MSWLDLLDIAASNLTRLRLRTFLTTSGVIIAVAAFVSMLSFGAGNQRLVQDQYQKFGLLYTMQVYQLDDQSDTVKVRLLDDSALAQLAAVPGVRLAYPLDAVNLEVAWGDTTVSARAQGLPGSALETRLFSHLSAGRLFSSDLAREVILTDKFLRDFPHHNPDSALGTQMVLTAHLATLDSALRSVIDDRNGEVRKRISAIALDSLRSRTFLERTVKSEAGAALGRFLEGLLKRRATVSETLTVVGVMESQQMGRRTHEELILPIGAMRRLSEGGISEDPADLFMMLSQGRIPWGGPEGPSPSYSRITLDLDPTVPFESVRDSVKALGFRSFSYAEQFSEIREFFVYFDLALGLVGIIALVTAALGIANTLFMAAIERRREIGVMQSLGARGRDIRLLFFVESGVIGAVGAALGLLFGWIISRVGSYVAQKIMVHRGAQPVDAFAVPWWLILAALAVGIGVSVLAGYFPASRAAKIDPVEALRGE
jgi:putative ABC transport system permease protein